MSEKKQSQFWCMTLNNYTNDEEFELLFPELPITYIIIGYETGESGTPHMQMYMEVNHKVRMTTMKRWPGFSRVHFESRKGTQEEAINYCKKDGLWFEIGEKKKKLGRGQRRDLDEVREAANEGGMKEVSSWGNAQQIRVAEKYLTYNEPKRTEKPTVVWLYGKTGCGKSRMAHEMFPDAYTKSDGSKWWDGYDRHENVILDDFRGNWMNFNELLTLLDRYERRVEFKGGSRQFVAKNIVITSCAHPLATYTNVGERIDQLIRRIDIIEQLGEESQEL